MDMNIRGQQSTSKFLYKKWPPSSNYSEQDQQYSVESPFPAQQLFELLNT